MNSDPTAAWFDAHGNRHQYQMPSENADNWNELLSLMRQFVQDQHDYLEWATKRDEEMLALHREHLRMQRHYYAEDIATGKLLPDTDNA